MMSCSNHVRHKTGESPHREIIQIYAGQFGCQLASACWELFGVEHRIDASGVCNSSSTEKSDKENMDDYVLYGQLPNGHFAPRTIIADSEPSVVDEIRVGAYRNFFSPARLISGYEDASSNFARGYFRIGQEIMPSTWEALRHEIESCEHLQGFVIYQSLSGGTGSGFVSSLLEKLAEEYPRSPRISVSLFPSPTLSCCTVESYNTILACGAGFTTADINILSDNAALMNICLDHLNLKRPTFPNINRVLAQVSDVIF
ncbi:unnamed protein product [Protopolystoma xenopodis]|uniref:Tubulin alpha chain n=1 Tax=Protopolystoma xenopodis TaxID=117903 RepID=A0A448XBB6_9PLAT|nr:unnamed protein product [Protopolystoma xenopodis]